MVWGGDDIANQVDEIYIEPPEPNIDTDEDNMGGTDLMDECIATYRIGIRSKKWY